MRSFRKVLLVALGFLACFAVLNLVVIWPYFTRQAYDYEDAALRDALAGSIDTFVSGASQAYVAVSPQVLDQALGTSSYNLSGSRMTMLARSTLLHKEIKRNPVKTVFLELSFDTMTRNRATESPEGDLYALPRMGSISECADFFSQAFSRKEYLDVYTDTLYRGFRTWGFMLLFEKSRVDAEARGYLPKQANDMSITPALFSQIHNASTISEALQADNERLFLEMLEDCQAQGIEVVIFSTPVSDRILARFQNFDVINGWYRAYAQSHNCQYLDFNLYRDRDTVFPDATAFADDNHLSEAGAAAFSRELAKLYARIQAGEDVTAQFYASYAEMDEAMAQAYAR